MVVERAEKVENTKLDKMFAFVVEEYKKKTPKSKEYYEEISQYVPGGVGSGIRWAYPYPFYLRSADGAWIYDVDGNSYIDYIGAHGPLLFGYERPKSVISAVKTDLRMVTGIDIEPLKLNVAEKIHEMVPCAEKMFFGTTGTEAVMNAVKLARAYSGKPKILKFEGAFQGYYPDVDVSVAPPLNKAGSYEAPTSLSTSGGVMDAALTTVVRPWNNGEVAETTIKEHRDELGAVLVNPLLTGGGGVIPPKNDFLKVLRESTEKYDIPLVFDEVITGFRLGKGGAQEYYNVVPDVAAFAKILGGGFALSAVCGEEEIMKLGDYSAPSGPTVYFGSTYGAHPLALIASSAILEEIQRDVGLYERLANTTKELVKGLKDLFEEYSIKTCIQQAGSMFKIYFTDQPEILDYRAAVATKTQYLPVFWRAMLIYGVHFVHRPGAATFVSASHGTREIKTTLESTRKALQLIAPALT